jgi:hypothetical protein
MEMDDKRDIAVLSNENKCGVLRNAWHIGYDNQTHSYPSVMLSGDFQPFFLYACIDMNQP